MTKIISCILIACWITSTLKCRPYTTFVIFFAGITVHKIRSIRCAKFLQAVCIDSMPRHIRCSNCSKEWTYTYQPWPLHLESSAFLVPWTSTFPLGRCLFISVSRKRYRSYLGMGSGIIEVLRVLWQAMGLQVQGRCWQVAFLSSPR